MDDAILRPRRADRPNTFWNIEFRPCGLDDFAAPLDSRQQELEGEAGGFGHASRLEAGPEFPDLVVAQHSIAAGFLGRPFNPGEGIDVQNVSFHTERKDPARNRQCSVGLDR